MSTTPPLTQPDPLDPVNVRTAPTSRIGDHILSDEERAKAQERMFGGTSAQYSTYNPKPYSAYTVFGGDLILGWIYRVRSLSMADTLRGPLLSGALQKTQVEANTNRAVAAEIIAQAEQRVKHDALTELASGSRVGRGGRQQRGLGQPRGRGAARKNQNITDN
ncbi:hypothetical protein BGZ46_002945 [Entomortierella lignicola]|nr:hypothetical protein BGZ46_002945 [Entomortierella lignicola]